MLVYFVVLFVVVVCAQVAGKTRAYPAVSRLFLFIAFAVMVLAAGMRNRSVGTDTGSYVGYFNDLHAFGDVAALTNKMGEHGFWMLTWLVRQMSNQYVVYLLVIAVIVVGCFERAIVINSTHIVISFFVFITMGFYSFFFNGARQGIATSIVCLAIGPLLEHNFKKYLAYVLLAYLFHKTAIVMLPLYFVFNRPNTVRNNLIVAIIGCFTALFFRTIVESASHIDARYMDYYPLPSDPGGGYLYTGFIMVLGVFFLIFKNSVRVDRVRYDRFLNMFLFGMMIGIVSSLLKAEPSGMLRFGLYFNLAAVFLWPIVFQNLPDRLSKFAVGYSFVVGYLLYFAGTTQLWSDLAPYRFNASVFLR